MIIGGAILVSQGAELVSRGSERVVRIFCCANLWFEGFVWVYEDGGGSSRACGSYVSEVQMS